MCSFVPMNFIYSEVACPVEAGLFHMILIVYLFYLFYFFSFSLSLFSFSINIDIDVAALDRDLIPYLRGIVF